MCWSNGGFVPEIKKITKKGEIWKVQRVVTQIKRKVRSGRFNELSLKSKER
jgi:glycerophosphoryl diester phosphodiesterase